MIMILILAMPTSPSIRLAAAAIAATIAVLAVAACGSDDDDSGSGTVAATTGITADLASDVAGPDLEVEQIVPDGASPHDYELSAEDRQRLEEADLVVANGAGLEAGIPLDDVDTPIWELADHAGKLRVATEGDEAGDADPHVWMSPSRVAQALPSLADAFAEADPEHAPAYRRRARSYERRLQRLELDMRAQMDGIKAPNRVLVTSHDSLSYFAERFGFEVAATVFPASGAEAGASAASLSEVEDAIRETGVPAVFAQEGDDPEAMRTVADETGVAVEYGLLVESPSSAGSYERMLRRDADLISRALGG